MKNNIIRITLVFLLISSATTICASDGDTPWSFGARGGLNVSHKHSDKAWNKKIGYNTIVFADYMFLDYLFVRAGFGYSTKGANYKNTSTLTDGNLETTSKTKIAREIGYLHAPLYFGVTVPITQDLSINTLVGGYLEYGVSFKNNYNIKSSTKDINTGQTIDNDANKETIKGQENTYIKKGDIGLAMAAEAEYKSFLFGVTYELGLRNASFGYGGGNTLYKKWYNRNSSIYLGYKFSL